MYVNKEVLPKKIIIHDYQVFDEDTIWEHKNNTLYCRKYNGDIQFLFEYIVPEMLNDEVEIIEDTPKKIEHIHLANMTEEKRWFAFRDKINEIIDKVNGGE